MTDPESQHIFDQFVDRSLPKAEWTHRAHLVVCWVALHHRDAAGAGAFLRDAITAYNEATGVENTTTSGYHETLTQYYVAAVAELAAATVDELFEAPACSATAPGRHWSRALLFSPTARAQWVDPDLTPLPCGQAINVGRRADATADG